jgi:hypothetical protein
VVRFITRDLAGKDLEHARRSLTIRASAHHGHRRYGVLEIVHVTAEQLEEFNRTQQLVSSNEFQERKLAELVCLRVMEKAVREGGPSDMSADEVRALTNIMIREARGGKDYDEAVESAVDAMLSFRVNPELNGLAAGAAPLSPDAGTCMWCGAVANRTELVQCARCRVAYFCKGTECGRNHWVHGCSHRYCKKGAGPGEQGEIRLA